MLTKKEIKLGDCHYSLRSKIEANITKLGEKLIKIEEWRRTDAEGEYLQYKAYFVWPNYITILTHDTKKDSFEFKYLETAELRSIRGFIGQLQEEE